MSRIRAGGRRRQQARVGVIGALDAAVGPVNSRQPDCPEGATASGRSPGRSVGILPGG